MGKSTKKNSSKSDSKNLFLYASTIALIIVIAVAAKIVQQPITSKSKAANFQLTDCRLECQDMNCVYKCLEGIYINKKAITNGTALITPTAAVEFSSSDAMVSGDSVGIVRNTTPIPTVVNAMGGEVKTAPTATATTPIDSPTFVNITVEEPAPQALMGVKVVEPTAAPNTIRIQVDEPVAMSANGNSEPAPVEDSANPFVRVINAMFR